MRYLVLAFVLGLGGCTSAAIHSARGEYDRSRAAYKACISAKPIAACAREQEIMLTDARALSAVSGNRISVDME